MISDPSAPLRVGYTLPVFACAAAIAAVRQLYGCETTPSVTVDLITPAETAEISIEQVALLKPGAALAITRSDPGEHLDLTRHTPIWAYVEWGTRAQTAAIALQGGEGIGKLDMPETLQSQKVISAYAHKLLLENLQRELQPQDKIQVTIILPKGRALAERTSNAAFGIVEGLALLGTTGIVQPLSVPQQLEQFRRALQAKATQDCLVFCVGENGLDIGHTLGIPDQRLIKTANWLGPMLVEAANQGVQAILLLGYHGKLIKLAGGIFHTHHHLADGRQEIFTAHCARLGLPQADITAVFNCKTVEAALQYLRQLDQTTGGDWVSRLYGELTQQIDQRSHTYIRNHCVPSPVSRLPQVGCALFDQSRKIFALSATGATFLQQVLLR